MSIHENHILPSSEQDFRYNKSTRQQQPPLQPPLSLTYLSEMPAPQKPNSEEEFPLIYTGYRAVSSHSLTNYPSSTTSSTQESAFESPSLRFDSLFESGNLDRVFRVDELEYDLYMRSDTNSRGHLHWFYYSVAGIGCKKTVRFNIVNFSRSSPLYKQGMKIRTYSVQRTRQGLSNGWESSGLNIKFAHSKLNNSRENRTRIFYQLSFDYTFAFAEDKVWFATTLPYNFGRLNKVLSSLRGENGLKIDTLCRSVGQFEVPLLTITDEGATEKKKCILIVARVHPSETVASWVVEGFLRFLVSTHPEAQHLRQSFVFKIVPMLNVDGVVAGNSRTGLSGEDLNRTYNDPDPYLHPEVCAVRALAETLTQSSSKLKIFIDIHGHFCKKGSFMYGPHFPLHDSHYLKSKIIPKLLSEKSDIFRFHSSTFEEEKVKLGAARVVMANEFGIHNSYTLENSYFGYIDNSRVTHCFSIEDLCGLGEKLARAICEYSLILQHEKFIQIFRAKQRKKEIEIEETGKTEKPVNFTHKRQKKLEEFIERIQEPCPPAVEDSESEEEALKTYLPPLEVKGFSPIKKRNFLMHSDPDTQARSRNTSDQRFFKKVNRNKQYSEAVKANTLKTEFKSNYTFTEYHPVERAEPKSLKSTRANYSPLKTARVKQQKSDERNPKREDSPVRNAIFNLYVPKYYNYYKPQETQRRHRVPRHSWRKSM